MFAYFISSMLVTTTIGEELRSYGRGRKEKEFIVEDAEDGSTASMVEFCYSFPYLFF